MIIQDLYDGSAKIAGNCMILIVADVDLANLTAGECSHPEPSIIKIICTLKVKLSEYPHSNWCCCTHVGPQPSCPLDIFSTILLYPLLLLDCLMYSFISIDLGKLLLVCQTRSDDGKYGASKADMGGKIRWSAHTKGCTLVFALSLCSSGDSCYYCCVGPKRDTNCRMCFLSSFIIGWALKACLVGGA